MGSPHQEGHQPGLPTVLALYTLARIGLVAVITGVLVLANVPLLVALLVALIVALPLSMFVFRGLRSQLDARLAEVSRRRRAEREALRARLRGDAPAPAAAAAHTVSPEPAEHDADGRHDGPDEQQGSGVDEHADQRAPTRPAEHPASEDDRER